MRTVCSWFDYVMIFTTQLQAASILSYTHSFEYTVANSTDPSLSQLLWIDMVIDLQRILHCTLILRWRFAHHAFIFERILSCTKRLSDLLQNQQWNLAKATDLVSATIETLEEVRSNSSWKHLFDYAQQLALINSLIICHKSWAKTSQKTRFDDSVVVEYTGSRECMSTQMIIRWMCTYLFWTAFSLNLNNTLLLEIWRQSRLVILNQKTFWILTLSSL